MTDDDAMIAEVETVLAPSYTKHLLLDSDSSGDELKGLRRNNLDVHGRIEQRLLEIQQEFAAALQGREAVTAQQEQSFLQCQESSAPHAQQPAALHAREAIAARQGMPQQPQERGLGSHYGIHNFVFSDLPPFASFLHLKQFQSPAGSYAALQTHEAIAGAHGSLDGVSSNVLHDLPPTANGPSLRHSIQFQEPAAPQTLKSKQTIAAAHEKPKLEPPSYYECDSYVPPAIPPVPSIQHPIQIRVKPFEKQLAHGDVTQDLLRLKNYDAERHVLQSLKPYEDPKQGIVTRAYDIAGNEYDPMLPVFKPLGKRKRRSC